MLERLFRLHQSGTDIRTEVVAGLTTFLTGAYIIFVNPAILAQTGMDKGALTTVTCLVAGLATLLVALWANAPLMMAPGMGLNAFFTYSLVLGQGVPWQTALGVVFLSGSSFWCSPGSASGSGSCGPFPSRCAWPPRWASASSSPSSACRTLA